MTLPSLTARNAELSELVDLLKAQADVKYDVVVPASRLAYRDGTLVIAGGAARVTDDGVTEADALLRPTEVFDEGVSERLGIPRQYLRRMRSEHIELLDANVNGWLSKDPNRSFLARGFRTDDPDEVGIARALVSDRYAPIDHLDVLLAALAGVNAAGVKVDIVGADLTERTMRVRINAPEVTALAPVLLGSYRSPYSGRSGRDLPVVSAGFEVRNSETGGGAFVVVPRITVEVCTNGMTRTSDALRQIHIGGKLEEGVINWSAATQEKAIELITAKTSDAVKAFLSPEYVARVMAEVEQTSSTPVVDAQATIERVAKVHLFTDGEAASILDCFIKGGDLTAGGVMQAVTAAAQAVDDGDRASEFEDMAFAVLATAAKN